MPLFPLNIMVELLINGTFIDVSQYVYQRDGIEITGGSQDKTPHDKPQPAKATLTFNDRDGSLDDCQILAHRFGQWNVFFWLLNLRVTPAYRLEIIALQRRL